MTRTKRRQCEGKESFPTRAAAWASVRSLVSAGRAAHGRMQAYRCRHCDRYHKGHVGRGRKRVVR